MDNTKWKELCQAIMQENDPQRLMMLVDELNQALEQREKALKATRANAAFAE
jgi:hypothetical protein